MLTFWLSIYAVMGLADSPSAEIPTDTTKIGVVNRIIILGNEVTKERIIIRELTLNVGDTVDQSQLPVIIEKDQIKLYNLRLFHTVDIEALNLFGQQIELIVKVKERWYTFPIPQFDLSDRNFSEWWHTYNHNINRVNYGLRLYQYNFRGRNETIRLTAQFGFTRRYTLLYRIPNIGNQQKIGLSIFFDYGEPKNLAYKTENHKILFASSRNIALQKFILSNVVLSYRKSFYDTHSLSFGYFNSSAKDTIIHLNDNYYGNGRDKLSTFSIGYEFTAEHRDVVAYPLHGYYFNGSIQKVGLGIHSNVNLWEISASYAYHSEPKKNLFFSNFTSFTLSLPSNQPNALFNSLGRKKAILRGYELYLIESPRYVLNKTTIKYKLFSRNWEIKKFPIKQFKHFPLAIYWKVYSDFGFASNYPIYNEVGQNTALTNTMLWGGGSGLDVSLSYDLILRFEYSFTNQVARGFYFNLKKEF